MKEEKVNNTNRPICSFLLQIGKIFLMGFIFYILGVRMMLPVSAASIVASGDCVDTSLSWSLDSDGTLCVSGTGSTRNYQHSADWAKYKDQIKKVIVNEGVTGICQFRNCENLETVILANSVTEIMDYAFNHCTNLKSLTMGENVTVIGNSAFGSCTNLQIVQLPPKCRIGSYAFYLCPNLELYIPSGAELEIDRYSTVFSSLKSMTFENAADISDLAREHRAYGDSNWGPETVIIKSGAINSGYFSNCGRLKTLILEEGVTEICANAFSQTGITEIDIPNSLKTIGDEAFEYCKSLTKVSGGKNLTKIGKSAFLGCYALTSVTLSMGATAVINEAAFNGCSALESITIPDGVTEIGYGAFGYCSSLSAVDLPDTLKTVGDFAFYECDKLKKVTIPKSVTSIGENAFGKYLISKSTGYGVISGFTIYGYSGTAAETYADSSDIPFVKLNGKKSPKTSLPVGETFEYSGGIYKVTKAGKEVSYQKQSKTNSKTVTIPSTVKKNGVTYKVISVGKKAFYGNKYLKNVTIGSNVRTIGDLAFANCKKLKSISINSKKLTEIGAKAFYGDSNLSSITLKTTKLKKVGANALKGIKSNAVIHVPSKYLKAYKKLLEGKGQGSKVKITK